MNDHVFDLGGYVCNLIGEQSGELVTNSLATSGIRVGWVIVRREQFLDNLPAPVRIAINCRQFIDVVLAAGLPN